MKAIADMLWEKLSMLWEIKQ